MTARQRLDYERTIFWDDSSDPGAGWVIEDELDGESVHRVEYAARGLLSVPEAAEALGCNRRTILRWISNGNIRAVKHGGDIRIPNSAVKQILLEEEE